MEEDPKKNPKETSIARINGVQPAREFHQSTGDKWIEILKAFNPLGPIADAYARTLAYKIETKRLDIELARINKQADIAHDAIDKTFRLKMEELEHRRIALIGFYQAVSVELQQIHIERATVLEMAQVAQQKAFEAGLTLEERQIYKEMSIEMIRELPSFGDKSNESLQKLVQALPPLAISPKLLEG